MNSLNEFVPDLWYVIDMAGTTYYKTEYIMSKNVMKFERWGKIKYSISLALPTKTKTFKISVLYRLWERQFKHPLSGVYVFLTQKEMLNYLVTNKNEKNILHTGTDNE